MSHVTRRGALALTASVALAPLTGCGPGETPAAGASAADEAFRKLGETWLKDSARTNPGFATYLGDHAFDGELTDVSAAGRAARNAVTKTASDGLAQIDRSALSRDSQVDAALLANSLASDVFDDGELQGWAWDPLRYSDGSGGSLYSLMARDFAPLPERLLNAASRMEKLPEYLAQARGALDKARVPKVHAETYAAQNGGVVSIIDGLILAQADALGEADRARLSAAAETAKAAVAEHQAWIDSELVPAAEGDFRIGAVKFAMKLAFSLGGEANPAELLAAAKTDLERVTAEMWDISRTVLGSQPGASPLPEAPSLEQRRKAIFDALDIAARDHAKREDVMADARATLADATAFLREKDIITLPDAPVNIIEMPKFQQGVSVAYCDSPGPLDRKLDTFYAISPIPADWTAEQTESFLREYNSRSLNELTVHEAMPGHYVQLWHSNRYPGVLRAVLSSGTFIEGWGVYAQDVMIEAGHGGHDPLRRLVNLKWALRVISNAILDQGIHIEGWEREQAMAFMVGEAFQEEREAAGKWTRARVSSTQLSTYFVGWSEHRAVRAEAEKRWGAEFNLKTYHDRLLSHGSPPMKYVRALLFDEAIG
jgi:uncharacterized protein (DUF885 family)